MVTYALRQITNIDYFQIPDTEAKWLETAEGFKRWNFPNCIGALDGKHITISPPPKSGSLYFNYKGHFSIILLALVNANYEFLYVDVGAEGRAGDAAVWNKCDLNEQLYNNSLDIPESATLPNTNDKSTFVIVADDAFKMTTRLIKPYSRRDLSQEEKIFNYRLSRARRVSENVFGILANRFRCFRQPLRMLPDNCISIVLCCCVLHNFLRKHVGERYLLPVVDNEEWDIDTTMSALQGLTQTQAKYPTVAAKHVRDKLCLYFNSPQGSVPWQLAKIR